MPSRSMVARICSDPGVIVKMDLWFVVGGKIVSGLGDNLK